MSIPNEESQTSTSARPQTSASILLMLVLSSVPYLPTLRGDWFWDDEVNIRHNATLDRPEGLFLIWSDPFASFQYYPVTYSFFYFEKKIFGNSTLGYHFGSLLIHSLNSLLIWRLLFRAGLHWPYFAAALWAVHPIQVETVGWITEQKNLLSTMFALLMLLSWREWLNHRTKRSAAAATLFLALALLSKTVVLVLVPLMIVIDLYKYGNKIRSRMPIYILWILMVFSAAAMTSWRETANANHTGDRSDTPPSLTYDEKSSLIGINLTHYVKTVYWPVDLVPIYPTPARPWSPTSSFVWIFAGLGAVVLAWRSRPLPLLLMTWFVFCLGPTLGLVPFQFQCHAFTADHFAYLALLAAVVGLVEIIHGFCRCCTPNIPFLLGILVSILVVISWNTSRLFADEERLWRHTLEVNPSAWAAAGNLGAIFLEEQRPKEAIPILQRGLETAPGSYDLRSNLGMAYVQTGQLDLAETALGPLLSHNIPDANLYRTLGTIFAMKSKWAESEMMFQRAIVYDDTDYRNYFGLGEAFRNQRKFDAAYVALTRAIELNPNFAPADTAKRSLRKEAGLK